MLSGWQLKTEQHIETSRILTLKSNNVPVCVLSVKSGRTSPGPERSDMRAQQSEKQNPKTISGLLFIAQILFYYKTRENHSQRKQKKTFLVSSSLLWCDKNGL